MRIPLSQLRFPKADRYTWGINVQRVIQRRNEADWLQLVRKNESGLASRMAHLEGIAGINPPTTLELLPYVTAREEFVAPAPAGIAVQRRLAFLRRRGARPEVRPVEQPHARRHLQPRLRPGRGRPRRRQPHAVRDVLRGAAAVLHRGRQGVRQLRPERRQRVPGASSGPSRRCTTAAASAARRRCKVNGDLRRHAGVRPRFSARRRSSAGRARAGRSARSRRSPAASTRGSPTASQTTRAGGRSRSPTTPCSARSANSAAARAIGLLGTSVIRDLSDPALAAYLTDRALMLGVDGHFFLDSARKWVFHGGIAGSCGARDRREAITRLQKAEQRYYQRPDVTVREAGSDRDEPVGLERPGQPQPQQRERHGEPRHLGHEPGARGERRRLLDADGPGRRARHGPVPQADPGPVDQRADLLGVEVVDVELGQRVAGRRLAGLGGRSGSRTCGSRPRCSPMPSACGTTSSRAAGPR